MKFKTVKHIAIAVRDLEPARELYSHLLGAAAGEAIEVSDQKVRVCFLNTGSTKIELIAPLAGNMSLVKFLEKRGEGLHHICFGVSNIEEELRRLRAEGVRLIDETPRVGAEGHKIAFIHPGSTGGLLIELEEE